MSQQEVLLKEEQRPRTKKLGRSPVSIKAFRRICISNFLLTTFVFALFPQLYGIAGLTVMGFCLLLFGFGAFLIGPLNAWAVEYFSRKQVFVNAALLTLLPGVLLLFLPWPVFLLPAFFLQGASYAMTQNSLCHTTANDILVSDNRTRGDDLLYYCTHLGLPFGLLLGSVGMMTGADSPFEQFCCFATGRLRYSLHDSLMLMKISLGSLLPLICGILAVMIASRIKVPVKAPIKVAHFGYDRFWRKSAWPLFVITILVSLVQGMFVVIVLANTYLPLYLSASYLLWGCLLVFFVQNIMFRHADERAEIVAGSLFLLAAQFIFLVGPGASHVEVQPLLSETYVKVVFVLAGAAFAMIISRLQMYFLKFSGHCCRATSQNTHFLGWLTGISVGAAASLFYLNIIAGINNHDTLHATSVLSNYSNLRVFTEHGGIAELVGVSIGLMIVFLLIYIVFIHPWFKKNKDREFKFRGY